MGLAMSIVAPKGRNISPPMRFFACGTGFATIPEHRAADAELSYPMRSCRPLPCFPSNHPLCWPLTRSGPRVICTPSTAGPGRATRACAKSRTRSPQGAPPSVRASFGNYSVARHLNRWCFLMGTIYWPSITGIFPPRRLLASVYKVHRNGSITYAHEMSGAAIIHPDMCAVIPLT